MSRSLKATGLGSLIAAGFISIAAAQETTSESPDTALFVELNTVVPTEGTEGGCRLIFMATNAMGVDLRHLVLEAVLLTTEKTVDRLTLFDLGVLPANRPRVRQFDVPDLACDALGQVLINGISICEGDGMDPTVCSGQLNLSTRTNVEIIG